MSNAQIRMSKSTADVPIMLQFRLNLIEQLTKGRTFHRTERYGQSLEPIPHFRPTRDHFHYPIALESRLKCKVHIQRVDTQYACAVCGVSMCLDPCFLTTIQWLIASSTMRTNKDHEDLLMGMADQGLEGE